MGYKWSSQSVFCPVLQMRPSHCLSSSTRWNSSSSALITTPAAIPPKTTRVRLGFITPALVYTRGPCGKEILSAHLSCNPNYQELAGRDSFFDFEGYCVFPIPREAGVSTTKGRAVLAGLRAKVESRSAITLDSSGVKNMAPSESLRSSSPVHLADI